MRHRHAVSAGSTSPGGSRSARFRERWREFASPEFVDVVPQEPEEDEASEEDKPVDPGPRALRLVGSAEGAGEPGA